MQIIEVEIQFFYIWFSLVGRNILGFAQKGKVETIPWGPFPRVRTDFRAILNHCHRCELSEGIFGERASVIGRQSYKKSASMWAA